MGNICCVTPKVSSEPLYSITDDGIIIVNLSYIIVRPRSDSDIDTIYCNDDEKTDIRKI